MSWVSEHMNGIENVLIMFLTWIQFILVIWGFVCRDSRVLWSQVLRWEFEAWGLCDHKMSLFILPSGCLVLI